MDVTHASYGGKHQFIFKDGGVEVGEISVVPVPGGFEVSNVLVWPAHQRKGWATRMYRHAVRWAREQGGKLFISNDRTPDALALHRDFTAKGYLRGREVMIERQMVEFTYERTLLHEAAGPAKYIQLKTKLGRAMQDDTMHYSEVVAGLFFNDDLHDEANVLGGEYGYWVRPEHIEETAREIIAASQKSLKNRGLGRKFLVFRYGKSAAPTGIEADITSVTLDPGVGMSGGETKNVPVNVYELDADAVLVDVDAIWPSARRKSFAEEELIVRQAGLKFLGKAYARQVIRAARKRREKREFDAKLAKAMALPPGPKRDTALWFLTGEGEPPALFRKGVPAG